MAVPQCDRQVYDCLKRFDVEDVIDAPEVTDLDDTRDILVTCDKCGNTTTTRHFWCGEFLPISMYCVRCRAHVPARSRYVDV